MSKLEQLAKLLENENVGRITGLTRQLIDTGISHKLY